MKSLFPELQKLSTEEVKNLWKEALFVFDANVLLKIIRLPSPNREDFFKTLSKITDRVWIPHQVALEFSLNKDNTANSKSLDFEKVIKELNTSHENLKKILTTFNKRHHITDSGLISEHNVFISQAVDKIKNDKQEFDDTEKSAIIDEIELFFNEKVGACFDQKTLDTIYKEGKIRFDKKIPPGFLDQKKEKSKTPVLITQGVEIRREFGDLILWKQIIEHSKATKTTKLIFITDDDKEDWWRKEGGKTIGPAPQLLSELYSNTSINCCHFYSSDRFLDFANQMFELDVSPQKVQELSQLMFSIPSHLTSAELNGKGSSWGGSSSDYAPLAVSKEEYLEAAQNEWEFEKEGAKEEMEEWFFKNYEDPANHLPYETKEGGYQWIYGPSVETLEALYDKFGEEFDESVIEELAEELDSQCFEWSPVQPDDWHD